jgi:ubiquinone/menaquinone biosynthesis C-methylase UbiE
MGMPSVFKPVVLLPRELLMKTGPVDHADWNFRGMLGFISRSRFHLVTKLLGQRRFKRLLEIGYGSGIFLPQLARHADDVYGLDVHSEGAQVAERLRTFGTEARLYNGTATSLPFPDGYMDCIVAVSVLEFVSDLQQACREVKRVLSPDGAFVLVTPANSKLMDAGLKLLTGESAKRDFGNRRDQLIATLLDNFSVGQRRSVPMFGNSIFQLYTGLLLRKPSAANLGSIVN